MAYFGITRHGFLEFASLIVNHAGLVFVVSFFVFELEPNFDFFLNGRGNFVANPNTQDNFVYVFIWIFLEYPQRMFEQTTDRRTEFWQKQVGMKN